MTKYVVYNPRLRCAERFCKWPNLYDQATMVVRIDATRLEDLSEVRDIAERLGFAYEEIDVSENKNKMSIKGYVVRFESGRYLRIGSNGVRHAVEPESEATIFAFRQQAERALGPGSSIVEITRPEPASQFVIYNPVVGGYFSTAATHYYSDQLSDAIRYNKRESAEAACLTGEVVKALVLTVRDV